MGLKERIDLVHQRLDYSPGAFSSLELKRATRKLAEQIGEAGTVEVEQFDSIAMRYIEDFGQASARRKPTGRDLRIISRHLFTPVSDSDLTFAQFDPIVRLCLSAVERRPAISMVRNLAMSFLFGFGQKEDALRDIANRLSTLDPTQYFGFIRSGLELQLFDLQDGPQRLSTGAMDSKEMPLQFLDEMGFSNGLEQSAFVEASFGCFCRDAVGGVPDHRTIEKVFDWGLKGGSTHEDGRGSIGLERYPHLRREFVDALLLPWTNESLSPKPKLETQIRNLLLETLGDPRFARNAAAWEDISNDARDVFIKWLNAASLRQFFEIVTETMRDFSEQRMWRYRRKFWTAYLPYIQDAWVVFAQEGARLAKRKAQQSEDSSFRKFGKFSSHGVQASHAVLLLRIGDTIIAEWSHSGKCRVWPSSAQSAPKLYKEFYDAADLRNGEWDIAHHQNEQYGWQMSLARELQRRTKINIRQLDYRVTD